MFFLQGRDTLLPDLPSAEANGPRASKGINTLASG